MQAFIVRWRMIFSDRERRALLALMRAAFPPGSRVPAPAESTVEHLERFLATAPAEGRRFLRAMLFLVEWAAVFRHGRRFSKLPPPEAQRYIEAWAHSRISFLRLAFRGLVSPLKIVHYGEPQVARTLGYDPPAETACAHPRPTLLRKPPLKAQGRLRCEVAVIGSGAGGATVAKALAE